MNRWSFKYRIIHLCSTFAKFSEKLTFVKDVRFSENFANVLHEWSSWPLYLFIYFSTKKQDFHKLIANVISWWGIGHRYLKETSNFTLKNIKSTRASYGSILWHIMEHLFFENHEFAERNSFRITGLFDDELFLWNSWPTKGA